MLRNALGLQSTKAAGSLRRCDVVRLLLKPKALGRT